MPHAGGPLPPKKNGRKPPNPIKVSARTFRNHPANKPKRVYNFSDIGRMVLRTGIAVIFLILIFKVVSVIEG